MTNLNLPQKAISALTRLLFTLTAASLLALAAWGSVPAAVSATPPRFSPPGQTLTPTVGLGPAFEQIVNLGVPVGNTTTPRHLALDSAAGLLYLVGDGLPGLGQGNDLSRYDLAAGEFTAHVKIPGQALPLDLQLDPSSERLYLVRQAPFGSEVPASLSVIDSQSLKVLEEIPGVAAVAATTGELYAASLDQLTRYTVAGDALSVEAQLDLPPAGELAGLALNPTANRLYLARADSQGWAVEIYQADSLSLISTFATEDRITALLPNPASQELLVLEALAGDRWVQRLDAAGRPLGPPLRLSSATGGAGLALSPDGRQLYFSNDELPAPAPNPTFETVPTLVGMRAAGLVPELNIPLPARFDELVIDPASNRAFALSPGENLLTVIDLNRPDVRPIPTAREIRDLLIDPDSGDLFLSDSGGGLRRLAADTFAVQAEAQLDEVAGGGLGGGELALDNSRDRLYLSGYPATTFEADTLTQQDTLRPGGQFSLEPGGEVVYLSGCGLALLDATRLISESVVPGSTRRADQRVPNPCVGHSTLDAATGRLYSLAPNGVPGSNGGNLLYVYDVSLTPTLIFTDLAISAVQAVPDPSHDRAFIHHQQGPVGTLRTLVAPPAQPPSYTHRLSGLAGPAAYSPATNRLYLSDGSRLLTLAADSLAVIAELPLPLNYDYRLVALDPNQGRLYLAGLDGQLLLLREAEGATRQESVTALTEAGAELFPPSRRPNGAILGLEPLPDGTILGRLETDYDFQREVRLFSTRDDGATWNDLSQGLPPGLQLQDVALLPGLSPTPTLLVALSSSQEESGGLYRSADGGQSWQPAMAGLADLAVNRLIVAADSETGLLLANTVRAGLHLSRDQGQSWVPVTALDPAKLPQPLGFGAAAISPEGTVLVTRRSDPAAGSAGLYRATLSQTGQLSAWQPLLDQTLTRLAFAPDGQTVLGYAEGLWRSTDGGESWQPGGAGLTDLDLSQADKFLFSPDFAQDQTVYLFFRDIRGDASGRLFRSTDGGESWQAWDNPPASRRFTTVSLAPGGELLLGDDQTELSRLPLADLRWAEPAPPAAPFPIDDLAVSPDFAADQTLFALSHLHGLWRSTDGGDSWQPTAFPVRSTSFEGYRLALSPDFAEDQTLFVATGFSLHRSTDAGDSWQTLSPPDQTSFKAERLALSPDFAADQTLLVSTPAAIFRSTDGGDGWEQVLLRPETAGSVRLLGFAPDGPAYAWFDYDNTLYRSRDGGRRWQAAPTEGPDSGEPVAVAGGLIAPDGTLLLRPSFYPQLLRIDPQGPSRQPLADVLPAGFGEIQALTYTPDGTLLAGGNRGLLRSLDEGLTWQVARNAGPLDQADISHLHATATDLFVGLRAGQLFRFEGEAASWQEISVVR